MNSIWDIILANTTSYARSRLCICNQFLRTAALNASLLCILNKDTPSEPILEYYLGMPIEVVPDVNIRRQQLSNVFVNMTPPPKWMKPYVYGDYHMFARTKPQCADILYGDDDVCEFIVGKFADILYGDDDVCEFIVGNMRCASYVTSLILAARGKRELALRVFDSQSIKNSQYLMLGGILGRDEQLIAASKCNARSIAVKAACLLGDEKLTNHYIESDTLVGDVGYNILEFAAAGGNIALVKQFMHAHTKYTACCITINMYLRTRDTKYLAILKFVANERALDYMLVGWCHVDILLINALIDIGYNFSTLEVRCIVSSCTVDVIKHVLQVTDISDDIYMIIESAASRADILAVVLNNPNIRMFTLTNDDILDAITVAVNAKNITNVKLLSQLLSDCEAV